MYISGDPGDQMHQYQLSKNTDTNVQRETRAHATDSVTKVSTESIIEQARDLPVPELASPDLFPRSLEQVKIVGGSLGGTWGVHKLQNEDGMAWVQKNYRGPGDHPEAEYSANKVYKICGAAVPEVMKYHRISGLSVKATEVVQEVIVLIQFVQGTPIGEYLDSVTPDQREQLYQEIRKHFVVDCLLGNYDIIGDSSCNILVTADGKPYRIDNGASYDYRATGSRKTADGEDGVKKWGPTVPEIEEMRSDSPVVYFQEIQNAREVYRGISDEEVIRQIDEVYVLKEEIVAASLPRHREIIAARIEYLKTWREAQRREA